MWVGGFGSCLKAKAFHTVSLSGRIVKSLEGIRNKYDPLDKVSSYLSVPIIR